jgi:hypothetical protein
MFGFTKLSPEERVEHERKKRIAELDELLRQETELRQQSLVRSEQYRNELEDLSEK